MSVIPTHAPERCPECLPAATRAAHACAPVACDGCGAIWEPEPASEAYRPRSAPARRRPASRAPVDRVRLLVADLLAWHLACAQQERTAGGGYAPIAQGSPTASVLRVLESGIVGDGCRGTKGTWRGNAPEPARIRALNLDARTGERYARLGTLREVADAVIADGHGDQLAAVEVWRERALTLSLPQRIGWALATEKQRAQWRVKIHRRDSAPALEGMAADGERALRDLLARWDALVAEEQREALARECREAVGR